MIGTSASGAYHVTSRLTDCPNGCYSDLSVRNRYSQLYHRYSERTLYRDPCHTTRMSSCSPENIGWLVTPPSHDYSLVGNWLRDNSPLLSLLFR